MQMALVLKILVLQMLHVELVICSHKAIRSFLTDHGDNSNINQALNKLIELVAENTDSLDKLAARQIIIENYMDTECVGRSVAKSVTSEQERQESINNAVYGMGW